jgi:hypothetical protein
VWKHLDRKTNAVSLDPIPGSISDYEVPFTIYNFAAFVTEWPKSRAELLSLCKRII